MLCACSAELSPWLHLVIDSGAEHSDQRICRRQAKQVV